MLTLQNDPPTLETCTDDQDQYKAYSKVFRKMVAECLRKEPDKRPTAKMLLRHEFFRKARVSISVNLCRVLCCWQVVINALILLIRTLEAFHLPCKKFLFQ